VPLRVAAPISDRDTNKLTFLKAFGDGDSPAAEQWRSRPDGQFLCNPPIQVAVLFQLPREGLVRRLQGHRLQIGCGVVRLVCAMDDQRLVLPGDANSIRSTGPLALRSLGACRPFEGVGVQGRFESALLQKRIFDRDDETPCMGGPASGCGERPGSWRGETGHGQPASQCECEASPPPHCVPEITRYAPYVIVDAEHTEACSHGHS
jgi:hypothetical protein